LQVRFNDGLEGIFPVEPERRGGVFLKLLDARVFNVVAVNPDFGCVEWPGGVELCPDTMHQAMNGAAAEPSPSIPDNRSQNSPQTWRRTSCDG
jgi:hypothetical protein